MITLSSMRKELFNVTNRHLRRKPKKDKLPRAKSSKKETQ